MELPPTILKHVPPAQVPNPPGEDKEMVDAPVTVLSKGKSREHPVIVPTPIREPEVASQKPQERISAPKEAPRFEVVNPKSSNDKSKNHVPQYKYVTGLMNNTNQEQVYQCILSQPVTLKLGELLGTSYDLGHRFQAATHSQCFPVQQVKATNIEVLCSAISEMLDSDDESEDELSDWSEAFEFAVDSREASSS